MSHDPVSASSENDRPDPSGPAAPELPRPQDLSAENLVQAGWYSSASEGFEHGLVVLSMGLAYWLVPAETGFRLLVEGPVLGRVLPQLESYDRERLHWPPKPVARIAHRDKTDFLGPLLWAAAVCFVFAAQLRAPTRYENWGALDADAVFGRGELWRPFTALFLHADVGHLLSNVFFGVPLFALLGATFGRKTAWALLAATAFCGNLAAAAMHGPTPFVSLGASTALFAALGLFTGKAAAERETSPSPWKAVLIPCAAGLGLLALLGSGGIRTDLAAHASGFAVGAFGGWLTTKLSARTSAR